MVSNGVKPALSPLGVKVMSMDLFLKDDETPVLWEAQTQKDAFTWRGTMEMSALREFLSDTEWGTLDYLLIDLPPGTDRLPNLVDLLPNLGGTVVVTIPSGVSQLVVKKSLTMAKKLLNAPVIGVVENMAAYVCALIVAKPKTCFHRGTQRRWQINLTFLCSAKYRLIHESLLLRMKVACLLINTRILPQDKHFSASQIKFGRSLSRKYVTYKRSQSMKFLCLECNTAMEFKETTAPDQGSLTAIFECPDCFAEFAMHMNPWETQMLKSLNVQLGGKSEAAQPMEMVSSFPKSKEPGQSNLRSTDGFHRRRWEMPVLGGCIGSVSGARGDWTELDTGCIRTP